MECGKTENMFSDFKPSLNSKLKLLNFENFILNYE